MSKIWRKNHTGLRSGKVVPISGSFVTRHTGPSENATNIDEEKKASLIAGLNEIIDMEGLTPEETEELLEVINLPPDQQIEKMIEERDELQKHIEDSPKVGFSANVNELMENKELLRAMNSTIKMMKEMTMTELQGEIERAHKMMSSSHVGFTAKPFSASEVREYVKQLETKMDKIERLDPSEGPPHPLEAFFGR